MSKNLVNRPIAVENEECKQPSPNKVKNPVPAVDSPTAHNDSDCKKEPDSNMTSDMEENLILSDKGDEVNASYSTCDENIESTTENESANVTADETVQIPNSSGSLVEAQLKSVAEMKKRFNNANKVVEKTIGKTPARRRKRNRFRLTLKKSRKYGPPKAKEIKNSLSELGVAHDLLTGSTTILDSTETSECKSSSQSECVIVKGCTEDSPLSSQTTLDTSTTNSTKNMTDANTPENGDDDVMKSAFINNHLISKPSTEKPKSISSDSVVKSTVLRGPQACSKSTEILSHYQILKKCLSQKRLYHVLQVGPRMFKCPLCAYQNALGQYVLLHLRRHRDLTEVFELYQNVGASFKEEVSSSSESPEKNSPRTVNLKTGLMKLAVNTASNESVAKKAVSRKKAAVCSVLVKKVQKLCVKKKITDVSASANLDGELPTCSGTVSDSGSAASADQMPLAADGVSDSAALSCTERPPTKRKLPSKPGPANKKCASIKIMKPSANNGSDNNDSLLKKTNPNFGISYRESLDPDLVKLLKQDLRRKVTPENPHSCKFCAKMFLKGTGIYSHYFKHARKTLPISKRAVLKKQPEKLGQGDPPVKSLVARASAADEKGLKAVRNKVCLSFLKLEKNVNQLLKVLVRDAEILNDLGWPERNVSDLVIDILERCKLQPAYRGSSKLSKLECLRKNVGELFKFCIKDNAMEEYGWNNKLVDDVVQEMLVSENYKPA